MVALKLTLLSTISAGQELVGTATLTNGRFICEPEDLAAFLLEGVNPRDLKAVEAVLRAAPERFDGRYLRATLEEQTTASKEGHFVTIDDRVVFIGGAGAGGGSGGAAATDRSLLARMPTFWERDVVGRSEHQLAAVDDADARDLYMAMENVLKTVNLDLSDEYLILTSERVAGDLFGQAGMRGAFGESKGKRFIAVSTGAIDAAIQRDGLPRVLQWEGLPTTATRADLLQHVMAHELGHRWYKKNPVVAEQWEQARMSAVSGYAIYCGFKSENFAEAFGLFTQGYDLPADVDGFFLENVR